MRSIFLLMAIMFASATHANNKLDLSRVLKATSKYADMEVALGEGFVALDGTACFTATSLGADRSLGSLGMLLIHPRRLLPYHVDGRMHIGQAWTNWVDPAVLIYEPAAGEEYTLVGIANLVPPKLLAWEGFNYAPTTNGTSWTLVADDPLTPVDEAYGLEPHYTLRLWLFRENPRGLVADFNPKVSCDAGQSNLN